MGTCWNVGLYVVYGYLLEHKSEGCIGVPEPG